MDIDNMGFNEKLKLARNRNTPVDVLRELSKPGRASVRMDLAENPNTPEDILQDFANSTSAVMRCRVARNPKAPRTILIKIFENEKNCKKPHNMVIRTLYANPNLPLFLKRVIETLFGEIV